MSPLRGLVLALTAVSAAWSVLRVPWETAFAHPDGGERVGAALVHRPTPLWSPPAAMSVEALAGQMSGATLPAGGSAVLRIRWNHWPAELLVRWVLLGAAAWPAFALAARRLPACGAAARFTLALLALSGLNLLAWLSLGSWGPPWPTGFAAAALLVARAAAAPEAGAPWLGMLPGLRPLAALALSAGSFLVLGTVVVFLGLDDAIPLNSIPLLLGLALALGLSVLPAGELVRGAWHLALALGFVGVVEFAVDAAERLAAWKSLGLRPEGLVDQFLEGLALLAGTAILSALAALLVAGLRRLRRRLSPCAN